MLPSVEAVSVHYGEAGIIRESIAALAKSAGVDLGLTVVDNGPGSGSEALLREMLSGFPGKARLAIPGRNLGYAGGLKFGMARAREERRPEYWMFLNHDVVVAPDAIALLVALLERRPDAAAAGPAILFHDGGDRIWNAGSDVEWPEARPRSRHHREPAASLPETPYEVGFLCGCAIAASDSAIERIGPMPEDYFLYFEDADWGERIRKAGLRSLVEPKARVRHAVSAASGPAGVAAGYQARNRLLFSRRWGPRTWAVRWARARFALRKLFRTR